MKKIDTKQVVEILGVLTVVVSLLFVGYELRLNREVAVNESIVGAEELTTSLLTFIGDNSSVWMRGCVGEELSEEEDMIFSTLVKALDRHYFYRHLRAINGLTGVNPEVWIFNITRQRALYPGLNEKWLDILEQQGTGSAESFYILSNQSYDEISENYTPGSFGPELCGMAGV